MLGSRGLSRREYFAELAPRLRRGIDSDATCWHTLDPHTRLLTSDAPDELVAAGIFTEETVATAGELVVRSEYMVDDVNAFADLARRRTPVGILDHDTGGDPERSARYRDVLAPAGIPHELRAAFVARGRTWGAVHIARRTSSGPFTKQDAAVLARVTRRDRDRHPRVAALRRRAPCRRRRAAGPRRARAGRRGGARHAARARAARRHAGPGRLPRPRAVGDRRPRGVRTAGHAGGQRRHGARGRRLDHAARVAARRTGVGSRGDRHRALREPPVRAPAARGARRERPRARGRHAARTRPGHDGDRGGARRLPAHRRRIT